MSRKPLRNRKKHSKKRRGRPKIVTDAPRRPNNRKRPQSNKKRQRKFKRGKAVCTICMNTLHGARKFLDCGHILHRRCFNRLLKEKAVKCPNCRKDISINNGQRQQSNPENRPDSFPDSLPLIIPMNADGDQSSYLDNSNAYTDDRSSDMDNSSTDSDDPSSNLDNPITDSPTPSSYFDTPGPAHPRPSRYLNSPSVELPVLFVPVLCCRCEFGSNARPEQEDFESNENNLSRTIIENDEELHRDFESSANRSGGITENDEELHRNFESNVSIRPRGILWEDNELERQIRILRMLLEDSDFTFNVLNSPAELDRDLMLNRHRRYVSPLSIPDFFIRTRIRY